MQGSSLFVGTGAADSIDGGVVNAERDDVSFADTSPITRASGSRCLVRSGGLLEDGVVIGIGASYIVRATRRF
jgi:hypothetical protein